VGLCLCRTDPLCVVTGLTNGLKTCFGRCLEGKPGQGEPLSERRAAQGIRAVPLSFSLLLRALPLGVRPQLSLVTVGLAAEPSGLRSHSARRDVGFYQKALGIGSVSRSAKQKHAW